jgi:hypothetical protein
MLAVVLAAQLLTTFYPSVASAQGPITSGETLTGTISPVGHSDTWTFSANTGDAIVIRVGEITQSGSFTPQIRLKDPSAALLSTASGNVVAEIAVTAASSGTFTVIVDDAFGAATGTYRLTLAQTGSAVTVSPGDQGGPLTNGAMQTGTIDVGDLDVWTVTANTNDAIVVRMGRVTPGSTPLAPMLRIYSPMGGAALVTGAVYGSVTEVEVKAPTSGTYLVVAGDYTGGSLAGSGTYRLTLAQTGSAVTVSPGDEGGPLNAGLSTGVIDVGDLDLWTLHATAGQNVIVTMEEIVVGSALTPQLRLYSPGGTLLKSSFGASWAQVSALAPLTGTYLVVAGDYTGGSLAGSGTYRITPAATTGVPETPPPTVVALSLSAPRPNPFQAATRLQFTLPQAAARVELRMLDVSGRTLRHLDMGAVSAGQHEVLWDGSDDQGHTVSAGVYFCHIMANGSSAQNRVVVVR